MKGAALLPALAAQATSLLESSKKRPASRAALLPVFRAVQNLSTIQVDRTRIRIRLSSLALSLLLFADSSAIGQTAATESVVDSKGLVHEALASPYSFDPENLMVADWSRPAPPPPRAATPPQPVPANHVWIPGYWSWVRHSGEGEYLWTPGIYRRPPPGRVWSAGRWRIDGDDQATWIPGAWVDADHPFGAPAMQLTDADRTPASTPPGADYFWAPGHWSRENGGYVWQSGVWTPRQPGWTWEPARRQIGPNGVVFHTGYWDYALPERGVVLSQQTGASTGQEREDGWLARSLTTEQLRYASGQQQFQWSAESPSQSLDQSSQRQPITSEPVFSTQITAQSNPAASAGSSAMPFAAWVARVNKQQQYGASGEHDTRKLDTQRAPNGREGSHSQRSTSSGDAGRQQSSTPGNLGRSDVPALTPQSASPPVDLGQPQSESQFDDAGVVSQNDATLAVPPVAPENPGIAAPGATPAADLSATPVPNFAGGFIAAPGIGANQLGRQVRDNGNFNSRGGGAARGATYQPGDLIWSNDGSTAQPYYIDPANANRPAPQTPAGYLPPGVDPSAPATDPGMRNGAMFSGGGNRFNSAGGPTTAPNAGQTGTASPGTATVGPNQGLNAGGTPTPTVPRPNSPLANPPPTSSTTSPNLGSVPRVAPQQGVGRGGQGGGGAAVGGTGGQSTGGTTPRPN